MAHTATDERMLAGLHPARRNRYYYGKMLDVFHLSMEQQYVLSKQWLYNRAVLGPGVACGLTVEPVTTADGTGIMIRSGLAFDGWGREIVVPDDIVLVPLALTDTCGAPTGASLPANVTVRICYRECDTDFAPAMVNDPSCGCGDDCEAGTIVETFCLCIVAGTAPPVTEPCLDTVKKGLAAGDLHAVMCELSAQCVAEDDDPCLTLANVTVAADGTLTVDSCGPRTIAPTNRILGQLIRCLADCCSGGTPPTPVAQLVQITAVKAYATDGKPTSTSAAVVTELVPPSDVLSIPLKQQFTPDVIEFTFAPAGAWDPASAVLAKSVLVQPANKADKLYTIGDTLRIYRPGGFSKEAVITVVGGPDGGPTGSAAVMSLNSTRLDGNYPQAIPALPSGDGTEGGDFVVKLDIN